MKEKGILGSSMSIQKTPNANRIHIGIFGKVNSGKSTLLNAIIDQEVAIVSDVKGTTTDPIYKAYELHGVGPVVFIDTAGFHDETSLHKKRLQKTQEAFLKSDVVILVVKQLPLEEELLWIKQCQQKGTPYLIVYNEAVASSLSLEEQSILGNDIVVVNAYKKQHIDTLKEKLCALIEPQKNSTTITESLCKANDVVLLVMPQDIQAPKGRLILPQVQTIRELLDKQCMVVSCTQDTYLSSLHNLKTYPHLIICDSQVFSYVYEHKPEESLLTSFSILFAHYKGDIKTFMEGAKALSKLTATSKVLIAEACSHSPLNEDIGRVKIPQLLHKKISEEIQIDFVNGNDFPDNIEEYDLIIHCGACMFNRQYVLSRIALAKQVKVPITNYGICIAYLQGILPYIVTP